MLSSFIRTVLGGHLWKGEKSIPTECAQGDMVPDTERCPDTCLDPEEGAVTLQQRLLKRAGYISNKSKRVVLW